MGSKPCGGAEFILFRDRNETMMNSVIMNVVESCIVAGFIGQARIPEFKPYLSPLNLIQLVDSPSRSRMESLQHQSQ